MPDKHQPGWSSPEKTKILFERLLLGLGVGFGLVLLLLVAIGLPLDSDSMAPSDRRIDTLYLLVLGGMALLPGLAGLFMRRHRHRLRATRDDLLRNGERLAAQVVKVVEDVTTMVNDQHPWRIHVRCEIEGTLCEFQSWSLWNDPTSSLASRTIDVYVMPNDPARYYVDTRFLEIGAGVEKGNPPARHERVGNRRLVNRREGKTAEAKVMRRSDAFLRSRYFTVPRLLFAFSLPFLIGGCVWLNYEFTFLRDGVLLEGRLEDIRSTRSSSRTPWYVISYQDAGGGTGQLTTNQVPLKWFDPGTAGLVERLLAVRPSEGERVVLRADWRGGRIRVEKWTYWLGPIFFLSFGAVISAFAWYTRDRGNGMPRWKNSGE